MVGDCARYERSSLTVVIDIEDDDSIRGTLSLVDNDYGPTNYNIEGKVIGKRIEMTGDPQNMSTFLEGVLGHLVVVGEISDSGHMEGSWSTTVDTNGTFRVFLSSTS